MKKAQLRVKKINQINYAIKMKTKKNCTNLVLHKKF